MKDYFTKKPAVQMEAVPLPRIRGKAFELPNKRWGYEMELVVGQTEPICMGSREDFEGYETKEEAVKELKALANDVMKTVCEEMGVKPEGFLDLTKNEYVKEI